MGNSSGEEVTKVLRDVSESCRRQQWSAAIRFLNTLSGLSSSPILLCNRALCYSKMDLHKHVLKDCNEAIALNSCTLQAYLYKGQALVAMGKIQEGSVVWQQGYEAGLSRPSDLQLLLQLQVLATQINFASPEKAKQPPTLPGKANQPPTRPEKANRPPTPPEKANQPPTPPRPAGLMKEALKSSAVGNTSGVAQKKGEDSEKPQSKEESSIRAIDVRMARGVTQVNMGKYEDAIQIFNQLLKENPRASGALIGRGTAYAFQRRLDSAIDDFTKAIELNPSVAEAWKRRGQARAALRPGSQAVADLSKALELDPSAVETLYERGVAYYKLKNFESAIDDLRAYLALETTNRYAYNYYGLALTSTGEYIEGMAAHYKAIELDPNLKEAWTHLAKLYKELGDAENSLQCLDKLVTMDAKYVHAYRLKGLLLFSLGDHRGAARELNTVLDMEPRNLDSLYLRGSCYHAIGNYVEAIKDYDILLDAEANSEESPTLQFLAFYQREIALYTVSKRNQPFNHFDIDGDLDPLFKEAWCKRLSPMILFPAYNDQPCPEHLSSTGSLKPDLVLTKPRKILLEAADRLGHLIQYNCPGFLKNARQHRMAGLAILDIAQKLASALQSSKDTEKVGSEKRKGDDGNQGINENPGDIWSGSGNRLSWRDVYSVAVKWRQASEPCDPVVWVDKLSEKEYAAGFGSHTPMLLGQTKVVRYYPNFPRAFVVAKELILEQGYVYNAANKHVDLSDPRKLQAVDAAANCKDVFDVVGEDFWLVTRCHSTAVQGKVLDGTRFTLQKTLSDGFDFSIRTPCMPPRWADYEIELTAAWKDYCKIYCKNYKATDNTRLLKELQDCVLRLSFYWYNFMPLARGTAAVGYIMLLALFLAADMEITASIPEGVQVDWEAILSSDVQMFTQAVQPWMYPSVKNDASWRELPKVSETFKTVGSVIAALSSHY